MAEPQTLLRETPKIDFDRFPRTKLCHQPTPIEAMPRLSELLGGPRLFIKRDDCTGLAMGGNKTRKLEFLVGEAMQQKADMLVTQGAVQSNHVRQTAAAACKVGMKCHASARAPRARTGTPGYEQTSGNVLLDNLFGATHGVSPRRAGYERRSRGRRPRRSGKRGIGPISFPAAAPTRPGALGYANCAQEIAEHSRDTGREL